MRDNIWFAKSDGVDQVLNGSALRPFFRFFAPPLAGADYLAAW